MLYQRVQEIGRRNTLIDAAAQLARVGCVQRRTVIVDEQRVRKRQVGARRKPHDQTLEPLGMKGVVGIDQATMSPRATAIPRLSAASAPAFACDTSVTGNEACRANAATISAPLSLDPSSTTISFRGSSVWAAIEASVRGRIPRMIVERHHQQNIVAPNREFRTRVAIMLQAYCPRRDQRRGFPFDVGKYRTGRRRRKFSDSGGADRFKVAAAVSSIGLQVISSANSFHALTKSSLSSPRCRSLVWAIAWPSQTPKSSGLESTTIIPSFCRRAVLSHIGVTPRNWRYGGRGSIR